MGREKIPYSLFAGSDCPCSAALLITFATSAPDVVYTFSGMFVDDAMADILKMLVYITVSAVLVYSRAYIDERGMLSGEFFSLTLFATLGMMVMISASHFLTLYLGLELLSLSQYAMVAMRRESVAATEAAIKFFVLGALASGFLLVWHVHDLWRDGLARYRAGGRSHSGRRQSTMPCWWWGSSSSWLASASS